MNKCKTLAEYVACVDLVKTYSKTMDMKEAIEQAIGDCINNDILAEFLRKHKAEVWHMNLFEYDAKEHIEMERRKAHTSRFGKK
ncbi:MAG: hypothetical protein R3Y67_00575 [Eubacteriales bacterium]